MKRAHRRYYVFRLVGEILRPSRVPIRLRMRLFGGGGANQLSVECGSFQCILISPKKLVYGASFPSVGITYLQGKPAPNPANPTLDCHPTHQFKHCIGNRIYHTWGVRLLRRPCGRVFFIAFPGPNSNPEKLLGAQCNLQ